MSVLETIFKRTRVTVFLAGIAMLALGIAMFTSPIGATIFIVQAVGWILVAAGVCFLVNCWLHRMPTLIQADLVAGLAALLPGACMLIWPNAFVEAVYIVIGILITLTGVNDCVEAFDIKKAGLSNWGVMLALGIITLAAGITVVVSPFAMAEFVMLVAGCALIWDGITEIVAGVRMGQVQRAAQQFKADVRDAAQAARDAQGAGADASGAGQAAAGTASGAVGYSSNGPVIPAQDVVVEDSPASASTDTSAGNSADTSA